MAPIVDFGYQRPMNRKTKSLSNTARHASRFRAGLNGLTGDKSTQS
jgi:hypothetical protein